MKPTNPNKLPNVRKRNATVDAKSAIQRRKERKDNRGDSESADWDGIDPAIVLRLIATIANLAGTITFGYTKDGGAYYINYYVGGESDRVYIRPTEDVDSTIEAEIESWST
jgi:hypothetical protein